MLSIYWLLLWYFIVYYYSCCDFALLEATYLPFKCARIWWWYMRSTKICKVAFFHIVHFLCMMMGVRYWTTFGRKLDLEDLIASPYKDHKTYLIEINIIKLDLMKPYVILSLFYGTDSKLIFLPMDCIELTFIAFRLEH